MRPMTKSNAMRVSNLHYKMNGIKGMVGCLDCMQVPCEKCPNSLRGQHVGKEDVPTLVVETSCDYNLFLAPWFWACRHLKWFECVGEEQTAQVFCGCNNGKNCFLTSKLVEKNWQIILLGWWNISTTQPLYKNHLHSHDIFQIKIFKMSRIWPEKCQAWIWSHYQKFKFLQSPVHLHYKDDIHYIVKLCFCLHNVMVMRCVENNNNPETEDMYNHTIGTGTTSDDKMEDNTEYKIQFEVNLFMNNPQC